MSIFTPFNLNVFAFRHSTFSSLVYLEVTGATLHAETIYANVLTQTCVVKNKNTAKPIFPFKSTEKIHNSINKARAAHFN